MNDLRTQVRAGLPNMMQQKAFDEASTRRVEMDLDGMARYGAAQTKAWEWNTHTAAMADLINEGEANWNNPQHLQNVRDRMDNETADYGSKHGWSGEVLRYQLGENNDKLWTAVVKRQGVDPSSALTIWSAEGGVTNPATKNPNSTATGIFQHTAGTWADQGGTDQDRLDVGRQIQLGVALAKENAQALAKDLGRQPQPWEVYLAHQQGIGGATALLHADPNASAASVLGGNTDKLTLNGIPADATAGQALSITHSYVDRHPQMYTPDGVPSAQNIAANYEQHMQQLADQARIDNPGDPTAPERYRQHYVQQTGQQLHAPQMTDQANWRVLDNSFTGPTPVKSWQEFMSDPARMDAYQAVFKTDRSVYDRVGKAITTNALQAWDPHPTEESYQLYKQLPDMSNADRENFSKTDLNPYYGAMPANQFYDLQKIQDKDPAEAAKNVKLTSAITTI